jgi:hypothetical protein
MQGGERNPQLDVGDGRPEAAMGTTPEREVRVRRPIEADLVGRIEDRGIPIG